MASSDNEADNLPETTVSTYYFEDQDDEPVSFSVLPLWWSDGDSSMEAEARTIFLHGTADNGLMRIYREVQYWGFDLCHSRPTVWVLSKDNVRFKLNEPRRSFQDTIRTVLIALHCLHYAKNQPEGSAEALWKHLARTLGFYEVRPSAKDLQDHAVLIEEAVRRDEALAKSKVLSKLIEEKPWARNRSVEDLSECAKAYKRWRLYRREGCLRDLCDNGGDILCCDGKCMRSFHATEEAGEESLCDSLGFSQCEVDAMQTYKCENCVYNQHQCFACGKLGSSDKSSGADVFQCVSATCGHFYHPDCVAKLLHRRDKVAEEEHKWRIAAGESFTCPVHKCCVCNQIENKKEHDLQFAVCRRCPKSFHRKCLPKEIVCEDSDEDAMRRAWNNLLPNRILIYCLKHDIDEEIGTPVRNHIKFPAIQANRADVREKRKSPVLESLSTDGRCLKNKPVASKDSAKRASEKQSHGNEKSPFIKEEGKKDNKTKVSSRQYIAKKLKAKDAAQPASQEDDSLPALDAETQRRLLNLRKEAESSISMRDIIRKEKVPYTHAQYLKATVEKSITIGKVEGTVQAVRAALQRLEDGGDIEDAKAVCDPDVLTQIFEWKAKLRGYLAPFIHGMRYTSFGCHFTKVDKLQEIVDKLHWYVRDGDMIVDFCCGANDFSCLMAKKLEETGKKCSYKNFDIFPAKNNFEFELRDWMTVPLNELPSGSKLVMGLNPPFGVRAALANKFIDKALEFKPKLLILIVPSETERLDEKKFQYDLVWKDERFLSGKSFYLPGSIDVKGKQLEQWNNKPPLLYLWSRQDWTAKHRTIAQAQGHLPCDCDGSLDIHSLKDDQSLGVGASSPRSDSYVPTGRPEEIKGTVNMAEGQKGCFSPYDHARESRESQSAGTSAGKADGTGTRGRKLCEKPPAKEAPHKSAVDDGSSRSREVPFENDVGSVTYQHAGPSMPMSHAENYYGRRGSTLSGDAGMMYGPNDNSYYSSQIWSSGRGPLTTYGAQNLAGQYTFHMKDANNYGSNLSEAEERYWRDQDMRRQVRLYGQQDPYILQRNYMAGPDPGYTHPRPATSTNGLVASLFGSSQRQQADMSVMQRYAPRLDEPGPIRLNNARSEVPVIHGDRYLDPNRMPQFGYQG